jgi:hypothetical protein
MVAAVDAAATAAARATNWLATSGDSLTQSLRHEYSYRRLRLVVNVCSTLVS